MVKRHAECSPETCMLVIEDVLNPWGDHDTESGVKHIYPKHSEHILVYHNVYNRKLKTNQQKLISDSMVHGWKPSHKTLAFNVNGALVEGQHRLYPAVKYQQTATQNVTVGLPPDYFESDIPDIPRKPKDILEAEGYTIAQQDIRVLNRIVRYLHPEEKKLTNRNILYLYQMYSHDITNAKRRIEPLMEAQRKLHQTAWKDINVVVTLCEIQNILEYVVVLKSWMEVDKSNKLSVDLNTYVEYFHTETLPIGSHDFRGTDIIKTVCIAIDRARDGTYKEQGLFGIGQYGVTTEFQELIRSTGKPMPFNSTYYDIFPIK